MFEVIRDLGRDMKAVFGKSEQPKKDEEALGVWAAQVTSGGIKPTTADISDLERAIAFLRGQMGNVKINTQASGLPGVELGVDHGANDLNMAQVEKLEKILNSLLQN